MIYDLIIIGGGPSGLSLAHCLRTTYKKILIIEKENSLGGSHKVKRVSYQHEQLFTEHSPRVYQNSYKSFIFMLKEIGYDFYDIFTPYFFSLYDIASKTLLHTLSYTELILLAYHFIYLVFDNSYGSNILLKNFLEENKFSDKSIDVLNRICILTDGGGVDKFTLNEFFQVINQSSLYTIYQPKKPNDIGLFKYWYDFLTQNGIEIQLNTEVKNINVDEQNNIKSVNTLDKEFFCKKLVIATPPKNLINVLSNSIIKDCFGDFEILKKFAEDTAYITYISMTFHYNKKIKLDKIYGLPLSSSWGLLFIILSNYMTFEEQNSQTVISISISLTDRISEFTGKTANQSTKDEILDETFRQLQLSFPNLEQPTVRILYPDNYYDDNEKKWKANESAFISAPNKGFIDFESKTINGLYNLGIHNGFHTLRYTNLDSAIENAVVLAQKLDSSLKNKYTVPVIYEITTVIKIIIFFIIMLIIIYYFSYR